MDKGRFSCKKMQITVVNVHLRRKEPIHLVIDKMRRIDEDDEEEEEEEEVHCGRSK